jgi:TetR/AcrR family transcriptional regulator, tetracycline repressor protein
MRRTRHFSPRPETALRPSERAPLSRDAILEAAIEYVDTHGLGALTMRRLGEVLGVEAMSIYHHVNGREDLLEGIVDRIVSGVRVPPYEPLGPADGWQTFLQHVAHAVRQIAVDHPALFPLIATRPPSAPWLRPPLRSLDLVEDFLAGLVERGVDDGDAVEVYKVFASFLLGHLLLEVAEQGASTSPDGESLDEGGAAVGNGESKLSLDDHPTVLRLAGRLKQHDAEAEFEKSIEALLDRLDAQLSQ